MKHTLGIIQLFARKPTIEAIIQEYPTQLFGILLLIFAIPAALPIPAVGYAIPFGIGIVLLSCQLIIGRHQPYIPGNLRARTLPSLKKRRLDRMSSFVNYLGNKLPHKPYDFAQHPFILKIIGSITLLCGLSMCLPIPLTNTIPAIGLFFISIGLLENDRLYMLLGITIAIVGIILTIFVVMVGSEIVQQTIGRAREITRSYLTMRIG